MHLNQETKKPAQAMAAQPCVISETSHVFRLYLVDDHLLLRYGLRDLLERQKNLSVVGESGNGEQACHNIKNLLPDLVVLDISMPVWSGIQTARYIKHCWPQIKILVFTLHEDRNYLHEMFQAGASGYALKSDSIDELFKAINATLSGQTYIAPDLYSHSTSNSQHSSARELPEVRLSPREQAILQLLAVGSSNKEVSERLGLGIRAIELSKARAMKRLKIQSRVDLIRYAIMHGWLSSNDC